jgi:hypothetical protein
VPGRQRWLVPVLIVVVSLTVGAGLLARELYRLPDDSAAQTVTVPTTSALSPEEQPGPPMVELAPGAAAHPAHESVRQLLQTHFDEHQRAQLRAMDDDGHRGPHPGPAAA